MAFVIKPDGTVHRFKWAGIEDFQTYIGDSVSIVRLRLEVGYAVYVDYDGLGKGLPGNPYVEWLILGLRYHTPIVGPAVVVSFEESGEDKLLPHVDPEVKKQFERQIHALQIIDQALMHVPPDQFVEAVNHIKALLEETEKEYWGRSKRRKPPKALDKGKAGYI
jgi:hypothetical protein